MKLRSPWARILFAGYFDRFPELKIISHHLGAMIPYFSGRTGAGLDQLGARTEEEDLAMVGRKLKKRPQEYFKMFYADTATFGSLPALRCGLEFFGADQVLFASDSPVRSGERAGLHSRDDSLRRGRRDVRRGSP